MSQEVDNEKDEKPEVVDVENLKKMVNEIKSKNERLENESKSYKQKFYSLREEIEKKEKAKLEETGSVKELLELEKNEKFQWKKQAEEYKRAILKKDLEFQVASYAKDAVDINDIIKILPTDLISVDEEKGSINGVKEAVNYLREKKPVYFSSKPNTGMVSGRPSYSPENNDFESLSASDKDMLFKKSLEEMFKN